MPQPTPSITHIQQIAQNLGLEGSVNDHVVIHHALTHLGLRSTLHHFRANCAQGTIRHIVTGVALEVREGVFLLSGERGWTEVRNKLATELNTSVKTLAFSHYPIVSVSNEFSHNKCNEVVAALASESEVV